MYKSRKFFAFLLAFLMIANTLTPLAYAYTPPEEELAESILIPEEEYEEQEGPEETQNSTTVVIIEDGQPDENLEFDTDVAPQGVGVVEKDTPEVETTIEEKTTDTYVFNFYMSKEDVKDQSVKPFEIKEVEDGERLGEPANQDVEAWLYLDEEGSEKELKFDNGKSEPISSLSANFNKNELDLFPKIKEEQEELEEVSLVAYSFHFVVLEEELDEIGEKGLAMIASLSLEDEEDEDAPSAKLPAEYIEVAEPTTGEVEDGGIVTAKPPELEDFELVEGQNLTFEVDALAENNFPIIYSARSNSMGVTEVDSSNTYVNTDFYKASPFGIAGNFHLVGLTEIDNPAHTNGNLLTPRLIYGSNFGTNRLKIKEVSYAREIVTSRSMTAGAQDNPDSYLVVGKNTTIGTTDNGNSWSINGQKLDYPRKSSMSGQLWQDKDSVFIDFDEVRSQVLALSARMVGLPDSGITINGSDMNNQSINITDSSKDCNVYNFKASDFKDPHNPIKITGFNPSKPTTLTINIDMAGKTSFIIPASVAYYSNGSSVSTGEVSTWSNANVIWHFYDSSKSDNVYRGSINNERGAVTGHIIAPGANVDLKNNINGTVIADKIRVSAESHRDDYTGPNCFGSDPEPEPETYAVGDYVWVDSNNNGVQDHGEEPLQGVTVHLLQMEPLLIQLKLMLKDVIYSMN